MKPWKYQKNIWYIAVLDNPVVGKFPLNITKKEKGKNDTGDSVEP